MTDTIVEGQIITEPGVYAMDDEIYHADPVAEGSLSFSGAKRLLAPSCPALFKHEQDNGRPDTDAFDLGHAAHAMVLGAGRPVVEVEAEDRRKTATKERIEEIRAEGGIPLLTKDYRVAKAMAEQLRAHPLAPHLFSNGQPEQSLFRRDQETGVWLRSRLDWLPDRTGRRMLLVDYKSTTDVNPRHFSKVAADFGYHMQAAFYSDQVVGLGLDDAPAFLFVNQMKTAPYLVTVTQLDDDAVDLGRAKVREAIDLYASCKATDTWPGYGDTVHMVTLPAWAWR